MMNTNSVERYTDHGRYFRGEYNPEGLKAVEQLSGAFPFAKHVITRVYSPKSLSRYLLVADRFPSAFAEGKTIQDVGSRDDSARQVFGSRVQLVDKNNPNLPPWDWEKELLPYPDNSSDTLVCLDTLEHINDFHRSFQDLLRVAKTHVVISLPNCWRKMFKQMLQGYGTTASYGLPFEKPMDRHKWFFNTMEIEQYFMYQSVASPIPFKIVDIAYAAPITIPRHRVLYPLMRALLPERYSKNLLAGNVFLLLEKKT